MKGGKMMQKSIKSWLAKIIDGTDIYVMILSSTISLIGAGAYNIYANSQTWGHVCDILAHNPHSEAYLAYYNSILGLCFKYVLIAIVLGYVGSKTYRAFSVQIDNFLRRPWHMLSAAAAVVAGMARKCFQKERKK